MRFVAYAREGVVKWDDFVPVRFLLLLLLSESFVIVIKVELILKVLDDSIDVACSLQSSSSRWNGMELMIVSCAVRRGLERCSGMNCCRKVTGIISEAILCVIGSILCVLSVQCCVIARRSISYQRSAIRCHDDPFRPVQH